MDVKNFERVFLLARQGPALAVSRRTNSVQRLGFSGTVKENIDSLKSFCCFWALDMAPTYAVRGLFVVPFAIYVHSNPNPIGQLEMLQRFLD